MYMTYRNFLFIHQCLLLTDVYKVMLIVNKGQGSRSTNIFVHALQMLS